MPRCSHVVVVLTTSLTFFAIGACSGSTVDSDDGNGGSGGSVLDSGSQDVTTEGHPEGGSDAEADVSVDVALDQSVEAEADGALDAEVLEGSLFDLNMPDVLLNDSGATLQGCYDCAVAACSSEMEACEQDDKCRTILLCLFEDQCFGGPNGIELSCGMNCATQAGVSSLSDPSVSIALTAGDCISSNCELECGLLADGGLPFDAGVPDGF